MAQPLLLLPQSWETQRTIKLAVKSTVLGDGYSQDMLIGTQPEIVEWKVKSPALTKVQSDLALSNLKTFSGVQAFSWSPDNGATIPLEPFYCYKWSVNPLGPDAYEISGTFIRDTEGQCISFAQFLDTTALLTMAEGGINFLDTYTRDTQPSVANAQGVTVNAFQTVPGRGGYFPPSSGTSEGQVLLIDAILKTRKLDISGVAKTTALNLATTYANALVTYFYQEAIPAIPTANLWLPHWLINSKEPFTSKGKVAPNGKFLNNGFFGVQVSFSNGIGTISYGSPNFGAELSDVYQIYTPNGKLLWQNVYSPLYSGTKYLINYWVSNIQLKGSNYRIYPNTGSSSGQSPLFTTESAGKIVLNDLSLTGNLIVIYSSYVGPTIAKNEGFEAFPMWRKLGSSPKEKNHALDVSAWLDNAYTELFDATNNAQWNLAKAANKHSTVLAAQIANSSYLFKKDLTTNDPFSYPGTQLIVSNNTAGGTATRLVDGWVEATINAGPQQYPVAELQNFSVALQMEQGVTLDVELSCSQDTILEIYLSTAKSAFDFTKNYTFFLPVSAGVNYTRSIQPQELIRWTNNTQWHPTIADNPIYSYFSAASATIIRELKNINGFDRLVSTATLIQNIGGYVGIGFIMSNLGNTIPRIYYAKTGSTAQLKVTDSNGVEHFFELPSTPDINTFQEATFTLVGADGVINDIQIVPVAGANSNFTVSIWYMGSAPEILPYPVITYKGVIASRVVGAHTFKVGNIQGLNSPLNVLKSSPGVIPFTANLLQDANGKYQTDAYRGMVPMPGYQSPDMWQKWGYADRAQQVLNFLLEAQDEYTDQSLSNTVGPFAPGYVWPSWENGVGGNFNTWTWDTVDPNAQWGGYQHRALLATAEYWHRVPRDTKAQTIVMRFLGYIDKFYRSTASNQPPTNYPEFLDPTSNYVSIQESAMIARAALLANLSGGNPSITFRVLKKSIEFMQAEYVATGNMAGSFSTSQPTFTTNSQTYKEYFPFWHAECLLACHDIITLKDQITYPTCSTILS